MSLYHVTETEGLVNGPIELNRPDEGMGRPKISGLDGFYLSTEPDYYIDRAALAEKTMVYTVDVAPSAQWLEDSAPAPEFLLSALRDQVTGKFAAVDQLASDLDGHSTLYSVEVERTVNCFLTSHSYTRADVISVLESSVEDYPGIPWEEVVALEAKVDWLRSDKTDPVSIRSILFMAQKDNNVPEGFVAEMLAQHSIAGLKWDHGEHKIYCALINDPGLIKITSVERHAGTEMQNDTETTLLPEVMTAESTLKIKQTLGDKAICFTAHPTTSPSLTISATAVWTVKWAPGARKFWSTPVWKMTISSGSGKTQIIEPFFYRLLQSGWQRLPPAAKATRRPQK